MTDSIDDSILRAIDSAQSYLWKWIPSREKFGGLLTGINIDMLDDGTFKEDKYMLQMNLWDKTLKKK